MNDANANDNAELRPAAGRVVYIRKLNPDELPEGAEAETLYAIHNAAGLRIGVAPDRALAFLAARQHDLNPVSVH